MPSDFSVHSDLLVHWTGKDIDAMHEPRWNEHPSKIPGAVDDAYICRLRDILRVGLWMTKQDALFLPGPVEAPAADCLCFTELKLSQSRIHAAKYGHLGIAVKRPFLFSRGGRPVVYFQSRGRFEGLDIFLSNCSRDLADRRLLQFFKPMDTGTDRPMRYDLYDESEWRIIGGVANQQDHQIIDPRTTTDSRIAQYLESLSPPERTKLRYLVPVDGWLAAIIYPSIRIKNKAQEDGSEVQKLIRRIAKSRDHAHAVEGDNLPAEFDLDLCSHF